MAPGCSVEAILTSSRMGMSKGHVVYMWTCCLCRSYWNKATTPACPECGHQLCSVKPRIKNPPNEPTTAPSSTVRPGTPATKEDDFPTRATGAGLSAGQKSEKDASHLLPSFTVSETQAQGSSSRGQPSDAATNTAIDDSTQSSDLESQQVSYFPAGANNPMSDHGAILEPGEPSQDGTRDADDRSAVSREFTVYTPEQVEDVVSRFTSVVLKQLRSSSEYGPMNASTQHYLLKDLRAALETFCEAVHLDDSRPHMQGVKIIRRVRGKIAYRIYEKIIRTAEALESTRPEVPGQEMGCADRVELLWHSRAPLSIPSLAKHTADMLLSDPQSPRILTTQMDESWDHDDPRQVWGEGVDPAEIQKTITGDEAFETLIREIKRVLDRYNCQKMDLIRRRTSLCLRRSGLGSMRKTYSAQFHVDWNLRAFMEENYECGVRQDINAIAAVTGTTDNALLCSVGEYFASQWPSSPKPLLDAITRSFQPQSKRSRLFGRSLHFYFSELHS